MKKARINLQTLFFIVKNCNFVTLLRASAPSLYTVLFFVDFRKVDLLLFPELQFWQYFWQYFRRSLWTKWLSGKICGFENVSCRRALTAAGLKTWLLSLLLYRVRWLIYLLSLLWYVPLFFCLLALFKNWWDPVAERRTGSNLRETTRRGQ